MRIVIDAQALQAPAWKNRGVGRFSLEIIKQLLILCHGKHEIILVLNTLYEENEDLYTLVSPDNIKRWTPTGDQVCAGNDFNKIQRNLAEIEKEQFMSTLNPDLVWILELQMGWGCNGVTSVRKLPRTNFLWASSLYDLVPLLHRDIFLVHSKLLEDWYMEKVNYAMQSDIIVTCSEYSKSIIDKLFHTGNKTVVGLGAVDNTLFNCVHIEKENYILFVSGIGNNKNAIGLMSAYENLSQELKDKYKLMFIGAGLKEWLQGSGIDTGDHIFKGHVTNEELVDAYRKCSLFVMPSISEGFGLPVLEAMTCGAPTICSNTSSLPEVIDYPEATFNPNDKEDITRVMTRVLTDDDFRDKLVKHGLEQSKKFSWAKSAENILNTFEKAYNER
jgi:glycosyltransferase involved in cell wall biosynthesis